MRTCPKCKEATVADDGYCAGRCREITMQPLNVKKTAAVAGAAIGSAKTKINVRTTWDGCAKQIRRTQCDDDASALLKAFYETRKKGYGFVPVVELKMPLLPND